MRETYVEKDKYHVAIALLELRSCVMGNELMEILLRCFHKKVMSVWSET